MAQNKVTFGLSNVYYSVISETGVYGVPVPMPGAVELTLEANSEQSEFYADNYLYYVSYGDNGYSGTLTLAEIPDTFTTQILGEQSVTTHNLIKEVANPIKKNFALLFQIEGDKYNNKYCLFNCSASRPTVSSGTQTATTEPVTKELTFTAMPRESDKAVKIRTTETTIQGVHDTWFLRVYDGVVNTATPATPTYNKAAKANIVLTVASTQGAVPKSFKLNGTTVPTNTLHWEVATNTLTLKQAYLDTLPNTTVGNLHDISIETDKGNYINIPLTVTGQ